MKAKLIDGKAVSAALRENLKAEVAALAEDGITPGLAVVIVGEDPASKVYVRNKKKACEELGMYSEEYALQEETTQEELLALVGKLNKKPDIDGILVQLPLPKHLDEKQVIAAISPDQGCGRVPRGERRQNHDRGLQVPALHTGGRDGAHSFRGYRGGRQGVCCDRAQQHRGQTDGNAADARKRHRDHLSQPYKESRGSLPPCGYSGRGDRQGEICHSRHGEGRRDGDRRGHEP